MIKTVTSDYFETLQRCPKAFYFKYVKGIRFADKKGVYKLGRDIHSLIYYRLQGFDLAKIEKNLNNETAKHWQNIQKNPMLEKENICAEWGFDIPIDEDYWLNGRIDAVFKDGDNYIIADWKTGQNLPYNPEESYQAMIYMWAFYNCRKSLNLEFEPEELKFIFVSTQENNLQKEVCCSKEMLVKIEELLKVKVKEMQQIEKYEKNTENCLYCPYKEICDK